MGQYAVDQSVFERFGGVHEVVASISLATFSIGWPVCSAVISSSRRLMLITSRAWISMSEAWPWKPLET